MRPVEFTTEEIVNAGQELQATGRNITGFALRQKIGGGNPSRLKQVWDEYLSSQAEVTAEPVAELPPEVADAVAAVSKSLADRLMELAVEVNDKAVKAAERRVTDVIRSMGEQREQAERELFDAPKWSKNLRPDWMSRGSRPPIWIISLPKLKQTIRRKRLNSPR